MKLVKSTALALAMAVSTTAFAEGYVGAGAGYTKIDIEDSGVSFDGSDTGWKVFGGYKFNDYFGLEVAYYDFGEPDDKVFGIDIDIEADGYGGFLAGFYPATDKFDLFAKLGVVSYDVKVKGLGTSVSDDDEAFAWGVGGSYMLNEKFALAAEWERVEVDDGELDMVSLSGRFHF